MDRPVTRIVGSSGTCAGSCSRTAEMGTPRPYENVQVLQLWKAGKRPPSWIQGRMFGADSSSQLAGVRLQLTDGKITRYAQSGSDATFRFADLPPGLYTLTADIPGKRNRFEIDFTKRVERRADHLRRLSRRPKTGHPLAIE